MTDRFRVSSLLAARLGEQKIALPALLQRAGLPAGFFQQEKIYVTTAELFALWRAIGEASADPAFGLRFGAEPRLERYHPTAIAAVCSRSFRDALQRMARYKQLTCPEEIRIHAKGHETTVEFFYLEAEEVQPDVLVDVCLAWIASIARRGTDGQVTPLRVELARAAEHRELLEEHYGCRVRFKSGRNALIYRSSDLDQPFVTHNVELLELTGGQLENELQERNASGRGPRTGEANAEAFPGGETSNASACRAGSGHERAHVAAPIDRGANHLSTTGGRNAARTGMSLSETQHCRVERGRLPVGLRRRQLVFPGLSSVGRRLAG